MLGVGGWVLGKGKGKGKEKGKEKGKKEKKERKGGGNIELITWR